MTTSTSVSLDAQDYPITGVLVFQDRAEVTRTFTIDLKAGTNEIDIKSLPSSLDPNTIRVQGVGKGVLVIDVVHKPPPKTLPYSSGLFGRPPTNPPKESDKIRQLSAQKKLLEGERKVLDSQAEILVHYAKSLTAENTTPENFLKFMESFSETGKSNLEAIKEKEAAIAQMQDEIQKERELPPSDDVQAEKRKNGVSIVVQADKDAKAELTLIYGVPNASWSPAYDIRGTTDKDGLPSKTVTLNYRASINQNTGEDWRNTSLTLSTAKSQQGNIIPYLSALTIKAEQAGMKKDPGLTRNVQPVPFQQFQQQQQVAPAATYNVPRAAFGPLASTQPLFGHTSTVPAGGAPNPAHIVPMSTGFGGFGHPQTNTSLFGSAPQQPVSSSGGLFGQSNNAGTSSSGLFGQSTQSGASGPSLFGFSQSAQASHTTPSTSLFGAAPTAPPALGQTSAFGASAFGTSTRERSAETSSTTSTPVIPPTSLFGTSTQPPGASDPRDSPFFEVQDLPEDTVAEADTNFPFDYATAVTEANSLAATYKIVGKTTIPSDSSTHKVAISTSIALTVDITVVAVPRAKLAAFWEAKVTNTSTQPLLSGPVSIFYDESFVANSWIPRTNPQEFFFCSLGMITSIDVTFYHHSGKPVRSTYAFAANTEKVDCHNVIRIKNNGNTTIPQIVVRDAIPAIQGESPFKVILTSPAKLATAEAKTFTPVEVSEGISARWGPGRDRDGVLEWIVDNLEKGENKRLETRWTVESPAGVSWSHSTMKGFGS
ncbi:hypothetical protein FRC03_006698 [Tulasnella sp. 419]|nr:hypothetical protein FRC03_006698 [Tulasnella sp. 419]